MKIDVNANIMEMNDAYAAANRKQLTRAGVLTVNIMGSPGAGKTTLLERVLAELASSLRVAVIEGDLATAKDAERVAACGCGVVQINTDGGCHLDAKMIQRVLPAFELADVELLIIENVGNLVCPTGFDLGEDLRLVVMSVTEGADKPAKYPGAFLAADWLILNKTDLLPYTDFDMDQALKDVYAINPRIRVFTTSCRSGSVSGIKELAEALRDAAGEKGSE